MASVMEAVSKRKYVGMGNMTESLLTAKLLKVSTASGFGGNTDVIECTSFSTLILLWKCRLQHAKLIINFAESREAATAGTIIARKVYNIRCTNLGSGSPVMTTAGEEFHATVPVLGPFCWVNITVGAVPTAYDLFLYGSAGSPGIGPQSQDGDSFLQHASVSLGAGDTTYHATMCYWGPAVFFIDSSAAVNWFATLYSTDYSGGFQTTHALLGPSMNGVYGNTNWFWATVALPPRIIALLITNNTGGAATFEFAVTAARSGV